MTFEQVSQLVTGVGVPLALFMLNGIRTQASKRNTEIDGRFEKLEKRIVEMERSIESRVRDVEEKKADKQAWMRETINAGAKMDYVSQQIAELKGRYDSEFGVAAAVNRLADSLKGRDV